MNFFKKIFNKNDLQIQKSELKITQEPIENKKNLFFVSDFEEKYKDKQFFCHKYCRMDGEWIEKGEKILIVRINKVFGHTYLSVLIKAEKSGFLEWTLKEEQLLTNGTEMYRLHKKGNYINENTIEKSEFKHFFYIDEPKHTFDNWLISDGNYIKKNEPVYQFKTLNFNTHIHKAERDGFIDIINPTKIYSLDKNELMYYIRDTDEKRIHKKYVNEPNIIKDDFTNYISIKWNKVSSTQNTTDGITTKSDNLNIDFLFSFYFIDNKDFIVFHFDPKQLKPKQFDKINFLFENGEQLEFKLATNPILFNNRTNKKILEYKEIITQSELELFANENFKKWKISLNSTQQEILGGDTSCEEIYQNMNNIQIVIKKFANDYINAITTIIPNYKPTKFKDEEKIESQIKDSCFVYLMQDRSNDYHKIGISNNPNYRERTLQSEKPTIEMIASKQFPTRKIAESIEKALHGTYAVKRLRGEWFDLDENDVENIKITLK